jgi:hypothetical protein
VYNWNVVLIPEATGISFIVLGFGYVSVAYIKVSFFVS